MYWLSCIHGGDAWNEQHANQLRTSFTSCAAARARCGVRQLGALLRALGAWAVAVRRRDARLLPERLTAAHERETVGGGGGCVVWWETVVGELVEWTIRTAPRVAVGAWERVRVESCVAAPPSKKATANVPRWAWWVRPARPAAAAVVNPAPRPLWLWCQRLHAGSSLCVDGQRPLRPVAVACAQRPKRRYDGCVAALPCGLPPPAPAPSDPTRLNASRGDRGPTSYAPRCTGACVPNTLTCSLVHDDARRGRYRRVSHVLASTLHSR
jgi:hypothetical protein